MTDEVVFHKKTYKQILKLGSLIGESTDAIIEALFYVNAAAMVCTSNVRMTGFLDIATETSKEIEAISIKASTIVADVFDMRKSTRCVEEQVPVMSAMVDRLRALADELKTVIDDVDAELCKVPLDIDSRVL